ncbi:MAG: GMC family oxidoreductase [Betaproteobacteria bacterium]|nr:GMC family oxidoreductase [Betaproteobacteria bacterium]
MRYDAIIIGSGAGGSAAAYHLTQTGKRVLLIERGPSLPKDGSTLDAYQVIRHGKFLAREPWLDRFGRTVVPEEHFNLGGKTKWYGAALLRFAPEEFEVDASHQCRGWPIGYDDLEPFYEEAENLLGVRQFPVEADMRKLADGLHRQDPHWRMRPLPLGLSADILNHPYEAAHFDAYASVRGLKADAENRFLDRVRDRSNLQILIGRQVTSLLPGAGEPTRISGVVCDDGSRFEASAVLLAAGALHSPRLLQTYMESAGLSHSLPAYRQVGRNYKSHMLTAMLALSHRKVHDVLCKTALLISDRFPHSSLQTLGGGLAADIISAQMPGFIPKRLSDIVGNRVYGLFLQTEDGSHPDNRVVVQPGVSPRLDYDVERLPSARDEHRRFVRALQRQLIRLGYFPLTKAIPLSGTAHACGTLIAGHSPQTSVVDAVGKVHGMANLYVVDGSILPRSSRVNPALTIYAWALRAAQRLGETRAITRDEMHAAESVA